MPTQHPRFIRVNADVYELKTETMPEHVTDEYFVREDLDRLTKEQDKFVAGVNALLPKISTTNFKLLEDPIKTLLMSVTTINVNLRSLPRMFKYDTPSEQFYAFEAQRWLQVSYLLALSIQLAQEELGAGMVDDLLSAQKAMAVLKSRHQKVFDAAHKNETRTVTADFDLDATQPVKVEREQAEKRLIKPTRETKQLSVPDLHQQEVGAAISDLLTAAKAIATAASSALSQYDDAAEAIASAHAHIKSDQMSGAKFAQTVKYAGVTYRRV
jgi:hypothetical protein